MTLEPGPTPRYFALKSLLVQRIQSGEFQPGDQFPTEEALCALYGLSRGTVRRALELLVQDNWLRREQGRGTFVTPPRLAPVFFRLGGFDEEMRRLGRSPATRLLQAEALPADLETARRLEVAPGHAVIRITRLRLADGQPLACETRCLTYETCPELLAENLESQSIHTLLIDKYNIPLLRAVYSIEARLMSAEEASLLQAEPGAAGFVVDRLTYTLNDRPVTWQRTVYRGDQYRFTAEF